MKILPSLQEGQLSSFSAPPLASLSSLLDEGAMGPTLSTLSTLSAEGIKVDDIPWPATPEANFLPPGLAYVGDGSDFHHHHQGLSSVATLPQPAGPIPSGLILGNDFVRLPTPSTVPGSAATEEARMGKSTSIAELQELLQSTAQTSHFRCPPGAQVLQWSYKQRSVGRVMFRAVVAFLHDGIAKHVAGGWGSSKKGARQSAAELALCLLHNTEAQVEDGSAFIEAGDMLLVTPGHAAAGLPAVPAHTDQLRQFCDEQSGTGSELVWRCDSEGSKGWSATLKLPILGVAHTVRGPPRESPELACAELARRVLWYLGCKSFQGCYHPDGRKLLATNCMVPNPPNEWTEVVSSDYLPPAN